MNSIVSANGDKHVAFVLSLFDTGLGAIRGLGRMGIPVVGLDPDRRMPGFRSKYCVAKVCPDPVNEADELLQFLLEDGRRLERPGILFPASDVFVQFVARYRDSLEQYYRFALPAPEASHLLLDKRCQYEVAERLGVPYPITYYPETVDDVHRIKDTVEYPAFIKPYHSHIWRNRFRGTKGFKVHGPAELVSCYEEIVPSGLQAMVQSIVPGPNTNFYKVSAYIDKDGEPLAVFTLRKIRQYPTEFGVGTLVESHRYPDLVELGLRFFKGSGFRGIGSIEFKMDDREGLLKMIELNPRLWQQNTLATTCGINFPLIQYLDLTDQKPEVVTDFREGVGWMDGRADFQAFWDYFRRGELSPRDWVRSWSHVRVSPTFAVDDIGPFLHANEYGRKVLSLPRYLAQHWT